MSVIEARNAYKVFGKGAERAVERLKKGETREDLRADGVTAAVIDATFDVQAGEIFVVMGLSGSGKSTLIRMVNGLLVPTSGSMKVHGREVTGLRAAELRELRREQISMVFQHFALMPHRTVGENAAYSLEVSGLNKADRQAKAAEALELVGLGGWGDSYPGQLSGGMQQRVGLARALASQADIMLMDEAFSALDPLIRREMQDQLIELQSDLGKTILFITHDLNEAMRLGDRVAMMRDGRIEQIGTAEQILNDPANDYVAQFVQDVDRARVLTASSVLEWPAAVLGREQGPRVAHKLMRENQLGMLLVVDRSRRLHGYVVERDVADAVAAGRDNLDGILRTEFPSAGPDTLLADLLTDAAEMGGPLPVVNENGRLLGVVPRVTLLNALGGNLNGSDEGSTEPDGTVPAGAAGAAKEHTQ